MPIISQRVRSLAQGLSTRPDRLRRSDQVSEQLNMISTERGVKRRPPMEHVAQVSSSPLSNVFEHHIVVSDDEQYIMVVGGGTVKVFDVATGADHPVTLTGSASAYIAGSATNYRSLTFNDKTVLVNRDKTVAVSTAVSDTQVNEAMIYVRQADYSTSYQVTLDGLTVTYKTPDANSPQARGDISTDQITKTLLTYLEANPHNILNFRFTPYGSSVIHITRLASSGTGDFPISVQDGLGDKGLLLIKTSVQRFEDLPEVSRDGYIVEITGDPNTAFDNSFVRYSANKKTWLEVVRPNTLTTLDSSTMPHILSRVGSWMSGIKVGSLQNPVVRIFQDNLVVDEGIGFDTDSASNAVNPDDDHVLTEDSDFFTATATNSFLATINYSVATLDMDLGTSITVEFQKNGVKQGKSPNYVSGQVWNGESFLIDVVNTDVISVILHYSKGITPDNVYKRAKVVLGGINNEAIPGVSRTHYTKTVIQFDRHAKLPVPAIGGTVKPTLDVTINNTLTASVSINLGTAANIALAVFNALQAAQPTWNVTVSADYQVTIGIPHGVDHLGSTAYIAPDSVVAVLNFNKTYLAWIPDAPSGISGATGLTVKNLTDGSHGTIEIAPSLMITTTGLSGGARNTFEPGDVLEIAGTSFILSPVPWEVRDCGDITTSPWPSFKDKQLEDVFYEQNRLGFITDNTVILSCTGKPYRFFRQTASQLLPTDVIDVEYAASAQRVSFHSAQNWNSAVYISHDLGQVKLTGDPVLTPTTVRLDAVSWFPNTPAVQPVLDGGSMYILRNHDRGLQVFEYLDPPQEAPQATDVTQDILGVISGTPIAFTGDTALGFLALTTDEDPSVIWVYSHKRQTLNAWGKWTMPIGMDVLALEMVNGVLAIVAKTTASTFLMYLDVSALDEAGISEKSRYLDRRLVTVTGSVSGGSTSINLPYPVPISTIEGGVVVMTRGYRDPVLSTRVTDGQWGLVGPPTTTPRALRLPDGDYLDSIGHGYGVYLGPVPITTNGDKVVAFRFSKGTVGTLTFNVVGGATRLSFTISWSGATPSVVYSTGTGMQLTLVDAATGTWQLVALATGMVTSDANNIYLYPDGGSTGGGVVYVGDVRIFDFASNPFTKPYALPSTRPDTTHVVVTGTQSDRTLDNVIVGLSYESAISPGTLFKRDDQTDEPETRGRTQLHNVRVEYEESSDFDVTVTTTGKNPVVTTLDTDVHDGFLRVPVFARNSETELRIATAKAGGFRIVGLDWEAYYNERSTRV